MPITNFVVSGILGEYLQAAITVFRDGKCGPARYVKLHHMNDHYVADHKRAYEG